MVKADKKWNGFAVAGFVVSLVSVLGLVSGFFGISGIVGIILSTIGLSKTKDNKQKGRRLAIAGLIISILVVVFIFILSFASFSPVASS
ncbi:DUF4190 domain-containing protein [Candidatus Pacearchaeota archaeon]|nr:DUF4190 domain-containing protein [Candidatus Pacearchaeota archaeon]